MLVLQKTGSRRTWRKKQQLETLMLTLTLTCDFLNLVDGSSSVFFTFDKSSKVGGKVCTFLQAGRERRYNLLTHKLGVQRALIRNSLKIQTRWQVCK